MINAPRSIVWDKLTNPSSISQWMGTPDMHIEVVSDWKVGDPILITGVLHGTFHNRGIITRFEPEYVFSYTHLSSASRLPDESQSYSTLCFELTEAENPEQTFVTLTVDNFPTDTIFKHLNFYWRTAMEVFKKFVEKNVTPA